MILPSNIAKIRKHLVILFEMKTLSHSLSPPMCTISAPNGHRPSCDTCVSFQFRFHLALCYLCHTKTNRHSATNTLEQTAKKEGGLIKDLGLAAITKCNLQKLLISPASSRSVQRTKSFIGLIKRKCLRALSSENRVLSLSIPSPPARPQFGHAHHLFSSQFTFSERWAALILKSFCGPPRWAKYSKDLNALESWHFSLKWTWFDLDTLWLPRLPPEEKPNFRGGGETLQLSWQWSANKKTGKWNRERKLEIILNFNKLCVICLAREGESEPIPISEYSYS